MPSAGRADRPVVEIRGLRKRFGGTVALDDVDLDIESGHVLALLGANGAGKSTIIKILAGVYRQDAGTVLVGGDALGTDVANARMAFIHQDLGLVDWMSIAENVALVAKYPRRAGLISWKSAAARAEAALTLVARHLDPATPVGELTRADRSLVAIARAIATDAEVLILDEPTASLPADDCGRLFEVLHGLRDRGHAIVYVSHRLDEVYQVADQVAVLRDGRLVGQGPITAFSPDALVHAIVGREPESLQLAPSQSQAGETVFEGSDLLGRSVGPASLAVASGEILGLVGLDGAGHMELGRLIAGQRRAAAGDMVLQGRAYRPGNVTDAVARGVGFVTSQRLEEGIAPDLSIRENFLANLRAFGHKGMSWVSPKRERSLAAAMIERFDVRPPLPERPIATLSGGNQQKILIGRWLEVPLCLLVLEEPTAGVDVGAKADIYKLLGAAVDAGLGVLLISTDFQEISNICSRALVFVRGEITEVLIGQDISVTSLTAAAVAPTPRKADAA